MGGAATLTPAVSKPPRARLLLVLVYLALIVAVFSMDLDPEEVRERLRSSGAWGPIVFVAAFAALQPLGVASHAFIIAAALIWNPWFAFSLSWIGAVAAGCVAFAFARYVGREWVQDRLPPKLEGYDERLAERGFRTVLLMRLGLFTFGPMQLLFGVSRVRFVPFVLASIVGLVPWIALETWFGGNLVEWLLG